MSAMINNNEGKYPTIFDIITDNEIQVGTYVVLNTIEGERIEGYYLESLSDIYSGKYLSNPLEAFGLKIDDVKGGEEIVINEMQVNDINFYVNDK